MIKAEKTMVELKGKKSDVVTEYSLVTNALKEVLAKKAGEDYAEFLIYKAMQMGFKLPIRKEDVKDEDAVLKAIDKLIEALKKEGEEKNG